MVNRFAKTALSKLGLALFRTRGRYAADGLFTVHPARFTHDAAFRRAYDRGVQASHGHDPDFEWRAHNALWAASVALGAEGDFVECGVNAGFLSSAILCALDARMGHHRQYFLIDSFQGPDLSRYSEAERQAGRVDVARSALDAGAYVMDVDRVRENFREWPRAVVVQGLVPEALHAVESANVAFLHIDLNCSEPEVAALMHFWPRIPKGGVVLFDDFCYAGCGEQSEALEAAAERLGASVLSMPTGQGIIIK